MRSSSCCAAVIPQRVDHDRGQAHVAPARLGLGRLDLEAVLLGLLEKPDGSEHDLASCVEERLAASDPDPQN